MRSDEALPFWEAKKLGEMSVEEWESLCDGCGKCCLIKLQDDADDSTEYTEIACRLLDPDRCRCTRYGERKHLVSDCVTLSPGSVGSLKWMPSTCAYRLLSEGRPLYWWHPLLSGDPETVHLAGMSVRHRVLSEGDVHEADFEDHIVTWPR